MKLLEVNIELIADISVENKSAFWDAFISDAIESNNLQYGGLEHGFIEPNGGFELLEKHHQEVNIWLESRSEVKKYDVRFVNSPRS